MTELQALIFDLDDTLYPERAYVLSGFRAVASWASATLGIPQEQGYADLATYFNQGVRGDTFNRWLKCYNAYSPETVTALVKVYRSHQPAISPFPAIVPLLDSLSGHFQLGLVSDGYLEVQQEKLNALGLAPYFDAIVFSDEFGREYWKPNTRPFQVISERLNVSPTRAAYIGDNPTKDFLGARNAGLGTIWARYSHGDYSRLTPTGPDYTADYTVDTIEALAQLLKPYTTGK